MVNDRGDISYSQFTFLPGLSARNQLVRSGPCDWASGLDQDAGESRE